MIWRQALVTLVSTIVLQGHNVDASDRGASLRMANRHSDSVVQPATELQAGNASTNTSNKVELLRNGVQSMSAAFQSLDDAEEALANVDPSAVPGMEGILSRVKEVTAASRASMLQASDIMENNVNHLQLSDGRDTDQHHEQSEQQLIEPTQIHRRMSTVGSSASSSASASADEDEDDHEDAGEDPRDYSKSDFGGDSRSRKHKHHSFRHHFDAKHGHYFDLHDALISGDHGYISQRLSSMSKKVRAPFDHSAAHGRRTNDDFEDKKERCLQLAECVSLMSIYDLVVYYHSDDLNTQTGELDDSIVRFDEENFIQKETDAKSLASSILNSYDEDECDDLLQLFHRNVEFDGIPFWEGATVGQVCFAQGTTAYVKLSEIAEKISVGVAYQISNELFQCSEELYEAGKARGLVDSGEPFVFKPNGEADFVIPTGFDTGTGADNGRDVHGKLKSNLQTGYLYEATNGAIEFGDGIEIFFCAGLDYGTGRQLLEDRCSGDALATLCDQSTEDFKAELINSLPLCLDIIFDSVFSYIDEVEKGFELVYGENPSVGFICGIKDAFEVDGKDIPGQCCLNAPYENTGALWGNTYDCTEECIKGPFLAGIDTEACEAQGGVFCPNPTDCSDLQACIAENIELNSNDDEFKPYVTYLQAAPNITDATSFSECGSAREYFGFDENFINDIEICENVEQLKFNQDFEELKKFFGQGSSSGDGEDCDDDCVGPSLTLPDRSFSGSSEVQSGQEWRSTNFALGQAATLVSELFDVTQAIQCPALGGGICELATNSAVFAIGVIQAVVRTASDVSSFTYGEIADVGNLEPIRTNENTEVMFENMKATGEWMDGQFKVVETEFVSVNENIDETELKVDEVISIVTPPAFVAGTKYAGCDSVDQDDDGMADNCAEDQYLPELFLPEQLPVKIPCQFDDAVCIDRSFQTNEDAIAYLRSAVEVIDDCSSPDKLMLDVKLIMHDCLDTVFELTPKHLCQPDTVNTTKIEYIGTSQRFVVHVDDEAPQLTCGFDRFSPNFQTGMTIQGNNLIVEEAQFESVPFLAIPFFFDMEENCPDLVHVEVDVRTNEFMASSPLLLRRRSNAVSVDQAKLMVAPVACASAEDGEVCEQDDVTNLRIYEIDVVATDTAGNFAEVTCNVVINPASSGGSRRLQNSTIDMQVSNSLDRFDLGSVTLSWDRELSPSESPSMMPSVSFQPTDSSAPSLPPTDLPSSMPSKAPKSSKSSSKSQTSKDSEKLTKSSSKSSKSSTKSSK